MSRMNIGRRTCTVTGPGTASSSAKSTERRACSDGRVAPVRPVPLAPGAEKSRLHAEEHIAILQEHLPELADVCEDAAHVLGIGAVVPAGKPVREADDCLQAVLPSRREGLAVLHRASPG